MSTYYAGCHFILGWIPLLVLLTIASVTVCQSQPEESYNPKQDNVEEQNYPYFFGLFQNLPSIERRNDFFLKASKSVPRIGRSDGGKVEAHSDPKVMRRNDFFLKASKSVPRIGRRDDIDLLLPNDNYPSISKRNDVLGTMNGGEFSAWPWFRNPDLYPKVYKKKSRSKGYPPLLQIWEADSHDPWNSYVYHDQDLINKEILEPRLQAET